MVNNLDIFERPKIKPELSFTDRLMESVGWVLLICYWIFLLYQFRDLPFRVPVHFDIHGIPNNYGKKGSLFALPVLASILFAGLSLLNRFPYIFSYPVKITAENAPSQYAMATRLIRFLKMIITLIFFLITRSSVRIAMGLDPGPDTWLLPLILFFLFMPVIIYIFKSVRSKSFK